MRIGAGVAGDVGDTVATRRVNALPRSHALAEAEALLRAGRLVALPTETVYGLCARGDREAAVALLYAAKGRPAHNPLIVHVASLQEAERIGVLTAPALRLAARFWPGPLTLVVERRPDGGVADAACASGATVALRLPAAPLLAALAARVGPIVAPSANRSGRVSATTADAVEEELGGVVDLIVDGGPSPLGLESSVVDVTGTPRLLRPGVISARAIEAVVGPLAEGAQAAGASLRSPGLLASHYAPRAALRLDVAAASVRPDEGWLAFGPEVGAAAPERTFRLSLAGDLGEAAQRLYAGLRQLDRAGVATIAVSPIPAEGLGAAIRDRLARAAAPRQAA